MKTKPSAIPTLRLSPLMLAPAARQLLFFALFYLYLLLVIDLRLIYHAGGIILDFPAFFLGREYLARFLAYPGGPIEYLSAFLAQFFHIRWAGPLIVTAQAWLLTLLTSRTLKAVNAPHLRFIAYVPTILMLAFYSQFTYSFTTAAAALAAIALALAYIRLRPTRAVLSFLLFASLTAAAYYALAAAFLLFVSLCVLYELLFNRRPLIALLFLAASAAIAYIIGILILQASALDLFTRLLPLDWRRVAYQLPDAQILISWLLFLYLPAALLLKGLYNLIAPQPRQTTAKTKPRLSPTTARPAVQTLISAAKWSLKTVILIVIAALSAHLSYETSKRDLLKIDYCACRRMWPQVFPIAARHPRNFFVTHALDRAFYHTGRLPQSMFVFPQYPQALFLMDRGSALEHSVWWWTADTWLELGHINLAEHASAQCLELFGERPLILKRLAIAYMAKEDLASATVYLHALARTLFDADWARDYLLRIDADPTLQNDERVQWLRSIRAEKDRALHTIDITTLPELLEKNRRNRMAFEYYMAYALLTGNLKVIADNLHRLDDLDYPNIPRLYEEALLLFESITKTKPQLAGRQISEQSQARFKNFNAIYVGRYRANKNLALNALRQNFGDTYFFYYLYGMPEKPR